MPIYSTLSKQTSLLTLQKARWIFFILLLICSKGLFASLSTETRVPVNHIYVPKGFDSNDRIEIIILGHLPNTCHRSPHSKVKVIGKVIKVELTSLVNDPQLPLCPQMIVPFVETVQVGVLLKGTYKIIVNGGEFTQQRTQLLVEQATPRNNIDDFVYAGVDRVDRPEDTSKGVVYLKGYNPSECYVLDRIETIDNGVDTYSVLPIMKKVSDNCALKIIPFSYKYQLPLTEENTETDFSGRLLHIRSMNGKAVNAVLF